MTSQSQRPLIPVDSSGLDDVAESLLNYTTPSPPGSPTSPAQNVKSPENYIQLPGKQGNPQYSYPDTLVAMELSHKGKNWHDCHKGLALDGGKMLTIPQFVSFLNLLRSGTAFDGLGRSIDRSKLTTIYNEITEVRDPYHAEWLDADYKLKNNQLYVNHGHKVTSNGSILAEFVQPIGSHLTENRTPGISLDDWLARPTSDGLPPADVKKGKLYYYAPAKDNNSVARFDAYSGRAYLSCNWGPTYSDSGLGVRLSRAKI